MKQIFTIAILLLLFACGEDDNNSNPLPEDLDLTKENVVGDWVLVNSITKIESMDSSSISYDTTNYGHEISLFEDGSLNWSGNVIQNWGEDTLQGNGDGTWSFKTDSNAYYNYKIVHIFLDGAMTYDSNNIAEYIDIIGFITKLKSNELELEQYLLNQNNNELTLKHKLIKK